MLTLYILRHGEAAHTGGGDDRDRPLTPDGVRTMQDLAARLTAMEVLPTTALCSPALRTRQTQRAAAPNFPVRIIDDMYNASADRLLQIAQGLDDSHRAALLIAHNPGVQQLVLALAQNGDDALRGLAAMDYKPGTLAVIRSRMMRWEAFGPDNSELVSLLVPPFAA